MSEWRRKAYYRTRVLIPVDECLDSAFGDCLVCLTGGELNLVRNLLLYAERRSTFVSEYHSDHYLAPTNEEWDDLEAMTSHLEGNLMNCEQFTADIAEMLSRLRNLLSLSGGAFDAAEEAAFPYDGEIEDDDVSPEEAEACAVAQLWYEWGYQVITEQVLPATRWGFDYLVPAVAGFIALAIGGPGAAMGVYAVAEFIQEIMEIGYRGAETNLVNWMDTNKQDIVCALYQMLLLGGSASSQWAFVYETQIAPAEDISYGDKLMLSLFMGTWAGGNAYRAFTAATDWADDNVTPGYCVGCDVGGGWVMEYTFPPTSGWELSPTRAEWSPEGWLSVWRGDGSGRSPTKALPGEYHYHVEVTALLYGNTNAQDGWVRTNLKTVDADWHGGVEGGEVMEVYIPAGVWTEWEGEADFETAIPYLKMQVAGYGNSDLKMHCSYLKAVFTYWEIP